MINYTGFLVDLGQGMIIIAAIALVMVILLLLNKRDGE